MWNKTRFLFSICNVFICKSFLFKYALLHPIGVIRDITGKCMGNEGCDYKDVMVKGLCF